MMKYHALRSRSVPALILTSLFLTFAFAPAAVAEEESTWHLRLFAARLDPSLGTDDIDSDTRIDDEDGTGAGISLEYRFSRRIGLELGAIFTTPGIDLRIDNRVVTNNDLQLTPIYAALNFHFTPERRVDVYAGPMLAYVLYDDLTFSQGDGSIARFSPDNDFAFGANLGADFALGQGRKWTFGASVKYIDTTFKSQLVGGDADDTGNVDVDPLIYTLGFGYRF